jgi:hypothetical protein
MLGIMRCELLGVAPIGLQKTEIRHTHASMYLTETKTAGDVISLRECLERPQTYNPRRYAIWRSRSASVGPENSFRMRIPDATVVSILRESEGVKEALIGDDKPVR